MAPNSVVSALPALSQIPWRSWDLEDLCWRRGDLLLVWPLCPCRFCLVWPICRCRYAGPICACSSTFYLRDGLYHQKNAVQLECRYLLARPAQRSLERHTMWFVFVGLELYLHLFVILFHLRDLLLNELWLRFWNDYWIYGRVRFVM